MPPSSLAGHLAAIDRAVRDLAAVCAAGLAAFNDAIRRAFAPTAAQQERLAREIRDLVEDSERAEAERRDRERRMLAPRAWPRTIARCSAPALPPARPPWHAALRAWR